MTRDNLSLYLYSLVMHVRDIRRYIVHFLYVNALILLENIENMLSTELIILK